MNAEKPPSSLRLNRKRGIISNFTKLTSNENVELQLKGVMTLESLE